MKDSGRKKKNVFILLETIGKIQETKTNFGSLNNRDYGF